MAELQENKITRNTTTIREQVYQKLRLEILNGNFEPGERIVEEDICKRYQVSRTPVRESLQKLENEKLLTHVPNKGAVVASWTPEDVKEVFQLRMTLEKLVITTLLERMNTSTQNELKTIVADLEDVIHNNARDKILAIEKFHPTLHQMAQMPRLAAMLKGLSDYLYRVHHLLRINPDRRREALIDHMEIAKAILANDKNKANKLIEEHLNAGYQFFLSKLHQEQQ